GEDRILIPSPKVATYDLLPAMNVQEVTTKLVEAIRAQHYALIVCNFANADMVGHTGNFAATVQAFEAIDDCLGTIKQALLDTGTEALITADHGNAECMYDMKTQQAHTAHTCEHAPLVYIGRPAIPRQTSGTLADIAPTLLHLQGLHPPEDMTGQILLEH